MQIARILLIVFSAAIVVSFFQYYYSSEDPSRERIESVGDYEPFEGINITAREFLDPSLFIYTKSYLQGGERLLGDQSMAVFYSILYLLIPVFGLLVFILAIVQKPIPALIFSILTAILGYIIEFDFSSRGIISPDKATYSVGYYMIYICAGASIILSIWMLIAKHMLRSKQAEEIISE